MEQVAIGLGSNLNGPMVQIAKAVEELRKKNVLKDIVASSYYQSCAYSCALPQPNFLNQVVVGNTNLSPFELLSTLKRIEHKLGRIQPKNPYSYQPRVIDLDILFINQVIIHTPILQIPHPEVSKRPFFYLPLLEVAPHFVNTIQGTYTGATKICGGIFSQ